MRECSRRGSIDIGHTPCEPMHVAVRSVSGKRVVACRTAVNGWLPLTDSNLSTCKASHIRNKPAHLALKASTLPSLSFISLPLLLHALLLK